MKLTVGLVLVEWSAGMLAGLVFVRALHRIGRGFTWLVGGTTVGAAAAAAFALPHGGVHVGDALGALRCVAGAAFLGAVSVGLAVGHWYLVDPKLPREVIRRVDVAFLATAVFEIALHLAPRGMLDQVLHSRRVGFNAVLPGFWVALVVLT